CLPVRPAARASPASPGEGGGWRPRSGEDLRRVARPRWAEVLRAPRAAQPPRRPRARPGFAGTRSDPAPWPGETARAPETLHCLASLVAPRWSSGRSCRPQLVGTDHGLVRGVAQQLVV